MFTQLRDRLLRASDCVHEMARILDATTPEAVMQCRPYLERTLQHIKYLQTAGPLEHLRGNRALVGLARQLQWELAGIDALLEQHEQLCLAWLRLASHTAPIRESAAMSRKPRLCIRTR